MRKQKSGILLNLIIGLTAFGAVALGLYPTAANAINQLDQNESIVVYDKVIQNVDTSNLDQMWEDAQAFNKQIANGGGLFQLSEEQETEYESLLNIAGDGLMGYVDIPAQKIHLPIYHGTSDEVLEKAVGHLAGTSLPVEGTSVHSVITGHTGLPNLDLFTDIHDMQKGDLFTITVLNRVETYQVDQIDVVLPEDVQSLQIVNGQNYCTLVTCTPYGVNDHRLLVRGRLINTEETGTTQETTQSHAISVTSSNGLVQLIRIGCGIAAVVGIIVMILIIDTIRKNR